MARILIRHGQVTAGEYFLTGLTACAINMIERVATESNIPLQHLDVRAEGTYIRNQNMKSHTLFQSVEMRFQFEGVNAGEAETLVATYHRRCPLYGTVAAAIPDVSTIIVADPD